MIVAMDGPAGAGKSTIARALARRLGFRWVNTGAIYRAVAHRALTGGVDLGDGPALARIAAGLSFAVEGEQLVVDGRPVGEEIRTAEVSDATSRISALPEVREALIGVQRELAEAADAVLEGRDIGTVVCPGAELKLFVTASLEERARRRWAEYPEGTVTLEEVVAEIRSRDDRDSQREVAPTRAAEDAIVLDTTALSVDEVLARVEFLVAERRALGA